MPTFRLSIRLLDGTFHGRGDGDEPEWPPSPLRAFQALVNAAASRWRKPQFECHARSALQWLEQLGPPTVVAPPGRTATRPYRLYVPNNAGDLMVSAWARGNGDASMAEHRTEKDVRPTRFAGSDRRPLKSNSEFSPVHYDWRLTPGQYEAGKIHLETLKAAARSITHLGWGVDQAVGHAELLAADPGDDTAADRWVPVDIGGTIPLRAPREGTLANLAAKHTEFLNRLSGDGFRPVPPLSAFRVVSYRRAMDPPIRRFAAFQLRLPTENRAAPFAMTRANCVAAMTRNATARVAQRHQPGEWIDRYVHGHRHAEHESLPRFSYLPLPTIAHRGDRGVSVGSIRRVLVVELTDSTESHLRWARQMLQGEVLTDDKTHMPTALLEPLPWGDGVLRRYLQSSKVWTTVTPLVLPGCDDGKAAKREKLFLKALRHAGYSPDALATGPELRNVSFWPGAELARSFQRPDYLRNCSAYHVRLSLRQAITGPVALGAGRHCGLGVFAAADSS